MNKVIKDYLENLKFDEEQGKLWFEWLSECPEGIKRLAEKFPPYKLFKLKRGEIVRIFSYSEDGTMTVSVLKDLNPNIFFEREVFGILPSDLEVIE